MRILLIVSTALIAALASACGSQVTPTIRASAGGGGGGGGTGVAGPDVAACKGVTKNTPITSAPPACANAWLSYQVSVVPPYDFLTTANIPAPPAVANHTSGAVGDADAQRWAEAFNRQSAWYGWAEAASQARFITTKLEASYLLTGPEATVLYGGGTVQQPACSLYPSKLALYALDSTAATFFLAHGHASAGKYVLLATFPAPCTITGTDASGRRVPVADNTSPVTIAFAGVLVADPVLGEIWKTDVAASCGDAGAPSSWCQAP